MASDLFLRALREEPVDRLPVWMMRQAGRYLPEYRETKDRAGGFLALCRNPDLAAEVTLQPVRRLGVDAAILFSDIMVPLLPAVPGLDFAPGPKLPRAITSAEGLAPPESADELTFVYDTIRILRRELKVPLIGFAGTPATVATYLAEGGSAKKEFTALRRLLHAAPEQAQGLLDWLEKLVLRYLTRQVEAGAQAIQLFDSWGGELSPADFERFCAPGLSRMVRKLRGLGAPVIYFAKGPLRDVGATANGVDWTVDLKTARARGPVQGNLDPAILLSTPAEVKRAVLEMAAPVARTGYVVNLGHGIWPDTPIGNAEAFVEAARAVKVAR
ncbi:MAG TPA: uroporphyrinogen decarboxylase [Planctomycetota bacterium]|nr:uroporphyrinogen decarboxylase [Planctomycetota bacterium]